MKPRRAQVLSANCEECRDDLLMDCSAFGLPLPTAEIILVPEWWVGHNCSHKQQGFVLNFSLPAMPLDKIDVGTSDPRGVSEGVADEHSERWKDAEEEIEAPAWWNNMDASKDIGYPVRENGAYGSYPGHDGFDDESRP